MLKILWKRGKTAPEEQFLLLSTMFYHLMLDIYVKTGIRFFLRDKWLFEITEVEITRVDCIIIMYPQCFEILLPSKPEYCCIILPAVNHVTSIAIKVEQVYYFHVFKDV